MIRTLDKSKDYAEVYGLPGVRFVQDGVNFNGGGFEIDPTNLEPINHEKPKPSPRDDTPIHVAYEQHETKKEDNESKIEKMHWTRLKAMVEAYGGIWSNSEDAIKFLKGGKEAHVDRK